MVVAALGRTVVYGGVLASDIRGTVHVIETITDYTEDDFEACCVSPDGDRVAYRYGPREIRFEERKGDSVDRLGLCSAEFCRTTLVAYLSSW